MCNKSSIYARRRVITLTAMFLTLPVASLAADVPANVQAVLDSLPAESPTALATLQADLQLLSHDDITILCDMLVEPGTGDDTAPRMALSAMTFLAGGPQQAELRGKYVNALCTALDNNRTIAVKRFLIRQLQLVATPTAVPHLSRLLTHDELCLPATQALLAIGGSDIVPAFRAALPKTTGRNHIAIIDALGLLEDTASAEALVADADSDDPATRTAVASALANLIPVAIDAIETARDQGDSWYDESMALANALHAADRMADAGDPDAALPIYQALWKADDEDVHLRCAALAGFVQALGVDAVDRVVAALTAENPELRAAASNVAVELPGDNVTAAFVDRYEMADAPARTAILDVLRHRGDAGAMPTALAALIDENQNVRLAAVKAAANLGQTRALPALIAFLETSEPVERRAARDALVALRGDDASRQMAAALPDCPPSVQVSLLDTLADRQAVEAVPAILRAASHAEESVRITAVNAIGRLGDAGVAPRLLELLSKAATGREREAISQALSTTCNRAQDSETRAAPVIAALDPLRPDEYRALLRALGRIGGREALETMERAAGDERVEVRETAVRALGEWPSSEALDVVLAVAEKVEPLKLHVLAMRAYARLLVIDAAIPVPDRIAAFESAMQAARRVDEKKMLLAKLTELKDTQTLPVLEPYLGDAELATDAASAMLAVAEEIASRDCVAARDAIEKVRNASQWRAIYARADKISDQVAEYEDFITAWLVAGPYELPNKSGLDLHDIEFPPEDAASTDITWQPKAASDAPGRQGFVDLNAPRPVSNCCKYLFTRVYVPAEQEIRLELGSDDGIKVWLNGNVVHSNNVPRGCAPAQDIVTTALHAGWNDLLIKVTNGGGGFGACARVRTADGEHIEGIEFSAER